MYKLNYKNFWKRSFDFLSAVAALVLLAPFLMIVIILIRSKMGSPIFFTQDRLGYNGEVFKIWKFRSMTNCIDENGKLHPDEFRLTRFGKLLRDWSIDELPQLWNVVIGDMSLIGPRPFIAEYASRYTAEQMRRHEVRPGISGWAQITGRNSINWNQKFILDVWYVDHCSLALDVKILFSTIPLVLLRAGITAENHATMPTWSGNDAEESKALSE
ncbi:MAG: sugar transferase [Kordiimonadaceae bacterium]|nr:sugar transferase [Kordiimonadaceae bacterium]MBT6037552.1 sugar transferase [Kordiimonadaceae bacterium]MBT6329045.1 sugar transferase [Kordiimonadaceae bacterium]